jgi:hypothetical protein
MDKAYPLRTHMVTRALKKDIDQFRLKEEEEVLGTKYTYLSVIGVLMYLVNNIRPDIVFAVNYLARQCNTYNGAIEMTLRIS